MEGRGGYEYECDGMDVNEWISLCCRNIPWHILTPQKENVCPLPGPGPVSVSPS